MSVSIVQVTRLLTSYQIIIMENMNNAMEQGNNVNGGFVVHVYTSGNQIIQTQNNNYYGTVYQGGSGAGNKSFSDEQIAKALMACVGKDKVIDCKWKWVGAYWYLRWANQYPVDVKDFCKKIEELNLDIEEKYQCDYRNIREIATLSFMSQDATKMNKIQPSKNDEKMFAYCREIALILAQELEKTHLMKA